ncbi:MAG: glycerate kinase [Nitrosomonadales bacterium]|nr:glycerate kinase [Nitrosomonadales bacterium]
MMRSPQQDENQNLQDIFAAALAAVDPYRAVLAAVRVEGDVLYLSGRTFDLSAFARIIVVGAGKATARMALAIESLLGARIDAGLIIVKEGHREDMSRIEQVESSHPLPGEPAVVATRRILEMAHAADQRTLFLCLLSGGASALLVAPVEGVTLQDKQESTQMLMHAGATIAELNTVRKHLSGVKGGRLAQAAWPAQVVALIVSDVIGDPLAVIASGPTVPDDTRYADAWAVIAGYGLQARLAPRVVAHLQRGIAGEVAKTVKEHDPCPAKTFNVIVASLHQALVAARQAAVQQGYVTKTLTLSLQGEARVAARFLAQAARDELAAMQPGERRCLLSGGETTVTVRGAGLGGRNQELALAFALEVEGLPGMMLLSAGTDGSDGPTDAAGAVVDGSTAATARRMGLQPERYLNHNDSYGFFQRFDAATGGHAHFKPGVAGTNVMDIQIMLLRRA